MREKTVLGTTTSLIVEGRQVKVDVLYEPSTNPLTLIIRAGRRVLAVAVEESIDSDLLRVKVNGKLVEAGWTHTETTQQVRTERAGEQGSTTVNAPMAGRIASIKVEAGSPVQEGQTLVVLEAMKMENEVAAPKRGVVKEVYVQPGSVVKAGDRLVFLE